MMTALLGYIDHFVVCMNIMLILPIINKMLQHAPESIGMKLQITHSIDKRIDVSNACETEFRIFFSLGDE